MSHGAIFLCAVLWSTAGLFIKLIDWHPMVIAGCRSLLAAGLLFALRYFSNRKKNVRDFHAMIKEAPKLSACGLCYTATMILFIFANKMTASANAILLQYTAPVWAALLGWFFLKEKPRWENWFALVFVCMGMFMVFSCGLAAGSLAGDMLAILSGILFAANSVVLRARKDSNTADILFYAHLLCVIFSIPFFFVYPPTLTVQSVLCIGFLGIFQLGVASALFAYGIKRVPAVQAMLTATIEPVLNPVWVLFVTGERPGIRVITGGAIIIAAVLFSSMLSALRRRN